jgi:hypothetical protein
VPTPLSETHISRFDRAKVQAKRWMRLVVRAGVGVYRAFERFVWNPFEVLTVFVRRLTIPLVDEDTWDKNLVVVCLPFAMLLFGVSSSGWFSTTDTERTANDAYSANNE